MREANQKSGFAVRPPTDDSFARVNLEGKTVPASEVGQGLTTKSEQSEINPFLPTDAVPTEVTVKQLQAPSSNTEIFTVYHTEAAADLGSEEAEYDGTGQRMPLNPQVSELLARSKKKKGKRTIKI